MTWTDNPSNGVDREGDGDQIRKIVIGMIYESRTNGRTGRGENAREGMKGGVAKTGVEIYGPQQMRPRRTIYSFP